MLPFQLRLDDFALAIQDVYDFFYDVNLGLVERGLERLDDMLRPAIMSGLLSDMLTASLAKHSRTLTAIAHSLRRLDVSVNGAAWVRHQMIDTDRAAALKSASRMQFLAIPYRLTRLLYVR